MTAIESQSDDEPNGDGRDELAATDTSGNADTAGRAAAEHDANAPPVDPEEEARLLQRHLRPDPFNLMWVW